MQKVIIVLLLLSFSHASMAKDTLYFSCLTENNAKVTVHRTADKSHYIYRFVRNGKVELKITQYAKVVSQNSQKHPVFHRYDAHSMMFTNGNYHYHLTSTYDPKDLTREDGKITFYSSVDVEKKLPSGEVESLGSVKCTRVYQQLLDEHLFEYRINEGGS